MFDAMPRTTATKKAAKKPATSAAAKDHVVYARVTEADHDLLKKVTDALNDAAANSGDLRQWSQADVVRAILSRRLRSGADGELP